MQAAAENRDSISLAAGAIPQSTSALLGMPFDLARELYSRAVRAGIIKNSQIASARFSRALSVSEKLTLGPWARGRSEPVRQRYKGPPHAQRPMIKIGCTGPGQTQAELVPDSYQALLELTTRTTSYIIGTSISTSTTVASAARSGNRTD